MRSTRRSRNFASGDALANAICALEVLQAASNVVVNVPFLSVIFGSVLGLARAVETATGDKERYVRLARRAAELSLHIEKSIESDPQAIDETLQSSLIQLHGLISRIRGDVERQLRRTALDRFLHRASIATILDDHIDALDSAWRAFDTACLIALRAKMEKQAMYDDHSQLRLFRWSDLRCLKVRGTYRVGCYDVGQEWQGKWDGRTVVVRTIRQSRLDQPDYNALISYYPNIHHPYIAQVLGYSHPSLNERFYVMDAGVVPLMEQFRGKDTLSRILLWLQHIVDYQEAFRYLDELGLPVSDCHSHDRCLPSAMLNEEGRLIIDASDFEESNLGCFQSRLRTICDEEHGALSPGEDFANDDDVALHASSLLSLLRSSIGKQNGPIDVEPFINSDLGNIWASHTFRTEVSAQWGDYGYIKRDGTAETFIRLGHIYDLVKPTGKISTFLLKRPTGDDWRPAEDYPWPEDMVTHTFHLDGDIDEIAVVRTLPDDCEYHDFFWNHAESVAEEHGIPLYDIVLFEEVFHYAGAIYDDEDDPRDLNESHGWSTGLQGAPSTLYFHQRPLLASGEAPRPWGYWSPDSDPIPGPWPILPYRGVELTCRRESMRCNYARVSTFEAEVLSYLNRLRRRSHFTQDFHPSTRIEELE
ncbi:hypothetical protein L227DRAFT_604744 [Lentinus tigrinus ALCF2SS1-6]|uniref:Protein kinase domain-containing protein n=1 Tax=Lentinus tigrinus ALCF2SS1-6 TaxID=1328759 RepID=A0A5C2RPP7_9APHY|nr:hypothetical protein L227DRAFT_604744 [Lentinus tigrinus ALCF2SS1-6]